ncbi:MAG: DNA cytosine methyltransferase [Candidatus Micrarchaeota archaeon]|nr:DNA cytosine methyltransferase [Candidatus Micrarchaeota archaeon]
MEKKKVLNLYSGIGGNRRLWRNLDITAVEYNKQIAEIYKDFFPDDNVVVADAHQYLLDHYEEFDFIWASPPCQTHSSFRFNISVRYKRVKVQYPDMRLYQEIIFLQSHYAGKWVVENVNPYYKPLIPATKLQRHLFWSNFKLPNIQVEQDVIRSAQIPQLQKLHRFDLSKYKIKDKRQILRNCVNAELGKEILESAFKVAQVSLPFTPYPKGQGFSGAI